MISTLVSPDLILNELMKRPQITRGGICFPRRIRLYRTQRLLSSTARHPSNRRGERHTPGRAVQTESSTHCSSLPLSFRPRHLASQLPAPDARASIVHIRSTLVSASPFPSPVCHRGMACPSLPAMLLVCSKVQQDVPQPPVQILSERANPQRRFRR